MKTLLFLVALLAGSQTFASVNCLRFMGKVDKVLWTKSCNIIIEDSSNEKVGSIDGCLGKMVQNGISYVIFNSDVINEQGRVKKDVIITKASYKSYATENEDSIKVDITSASPELFTRYHHTLNFDKNSEILQIKKEKGTFRLKQQFDLQLQCQ